jgi:carbon storage regulator
MLIIRRRAGESILIGDGVEVQVTEISGARVKLGIIAPAEVTILRKEVKLTRDQNVAAARGIPLGQLAELAAQVGRGRGA